jgi:autotransporter-associated beta strand protein
MLHRAVGAALVGGLLAGAGGSLRAASWDTLPGVAGPGDGIVNGGSGLWDLSTANWTFDSGFNNGAWANFDDAEFGGATGGLVAISGGGVFANSLTFDPTADLSRYAIVGQTPADVLTLVGSGTITTNDGATLYASIGGSAGLNKQGVGVLTLGGANTFSGPLVVSGGTLTVGDTSNLGSADSLTISGGSTFAATGAVSYSGNVSISGGGGTIALANPAATVTLSGLLSGSDPLLIDGTGGGALNVTSAGNYNGFSNSFTGNVTLTGGGSATFAHTIVAGAGQTYAAGAGTLTLGNSLPGATVTLSAGSQAQAYGSGVVQLFGRALGPGTGLVVAGDISAYGSGRVIVGDGLDDSAQIAFVNSAHLLANGGTIVLKPRATPLALDPGSVGGISLYNGGTHALAGTTDLLINRDVDQSGNWVLANQSLNTLRLAGASQDTTAGLTLRAESGVTRYEVESVTLG